MQERVRSISRIILTGKNKKIQRKTWPSATLPTTNPAYTGLQVNQGVCVQRVLQIQAVYCLRGYATETATQLFCAQLVMYAIYHISNIWIIFFNIKYPSLLTKVQPDKTACSEGI